MRRVLSDLHERISGAPLSSASLADFAKQWLARKEPEISPITFVTYKSVVEELVTALPSKAKLGIQYITTADIATFRDATATRTTGANANNKLKVVRAMFQSAWRDGFVQENVASKVQILPSAESVRRPFSVPELQKLLAVASDEWRGMVLAGLYLGQRLKDIATLRWSGVDLQKKAVTLKTSKTGRLQVLPIAQPLADYLLGLPSKDDPAAPVFPKACASVEHNKGRTGTLSTEFYQILVAAGLVNARLPKNKSKGVGRSAKRERCEISFHCLRHTATSLLKAAGVPESVVRDIIGHDTEEMSRRYTHVDDPSRRSAISKLPAILAIA